MARRPAEIQHAGPMNVHVMRGSLAELKYRTLSGIPDLHPDVLAPGLPRTPAHNLMFHGGKTIPNLTFTNFYVGGDAWSDSDIENIDGSLAAAMSEPTLNNVMAQYFSTIPTSNFRPSQKLAGARPATVSQGDVEQLVLHASIFRNRSPRQYRQTLCQRYRHMRAKGKPTPVIIAAIARELAGFVWSVACITSDPPAKTSAITTTSDEVSPTKSTGQSRSLRRQPLKTTHRAARPQGRRFDLADGAACRFRWRFPGTSRPRSSR